MDKPSRRSALLGDLRDAGEAFVHESRSGPATAGDERYWVCHLLPDPKIKDKRGLPTIAEFADIGRPYQLPEADRPLFTWNGKASEPVVSKTGNDLVNTSECFPPALALLALDYLDQGYGGGDTLYDQFVRRVGALLLCAATPRDFQRDAGRRGVGLHFKDPRSTALPEGAYIVNDALVFEQMRLSTLPALDIHDLTHHPVQMGIPAWNEFYRWLASCAATPLAEGSEAARRRFPLLQLVANATLEYSIVLAAEGVQSFGCLNWQAPRKTVLQTGVHKGQAFRLLDYPYGARDFNQWTAFRAVTSIYRRELEARQTLGNASTLGWTEAMGYALDRRWLARIRPFRDIDLSDEPLDAAYRAGLEAPETPEALFSLGRRLIEAELRI